MAEEKKALYITDDDFASSIQNNTLALVDFWAPWCGPCLMLGPIIDVNSKQQIRFGLGAIKGVGEAAVQHIIAVREATGNFNDIFDFIEKVDLKAVNKKTLEVLAMAGAFDWFKDIHRRQYVFAAAGEASFLEKLVHYSNQVRQEKEAAQQSLFGMDAAQSYRNKPAIPVCDPYEPLEKLRIEKDLVGFYISGHPLEEFRVELTYFCNCHTQNVLRFTQQEVRFGGMITDYTIKYNKQGRPFALFTVEDYAGSLDIALFGEDYLKNKHMLQKGTFVYIIGIVAARYNQPDVWELRPQKITLLSEVRERLSKKLLIKLPLESITSTLVEEVRSIIMEFPGNCSFHVAVEDEKEGIRVELFTGNHRVNPTNELLDKLNQIKDISYHLLTA